MAVTTARRKASVITDRPRALAPRSRWRSEYAQAAILIDLSIAGLAFTLAAILRFGLDGGQLATAEVTVSYQVVVALLVPFWIGLLALSGAYEAKHVGIGSEEYRRILNSTVRFIALVASISYFLKLELARGMLAIALPLALAGTMAGRNCIRRWVSKRRALGRFTEDLLVVGSPQSIIPLVRHFRRAPDAGFTVMGAIVGGGLLALDVDGDAVPVLGDPDNLLEVLANTQADAIAIADTTALPEGALRELAWHLEGTGVDLLVAPAITDVAGPRVAVRPIAGLPLLHVEEPEFVGARRVMKGVFDRAGAALGLLALAPLFVVVLLLIRLTSPGPAFFRQQRLGQTGATFRVWKFRTMYVDAEERLAPLLEHNEKSGLLFKMKDDPRITRVGRWLRRFSIDELPQLINVVLGHMSLVGPRPLPVTKADMADHQYDVVRRQLVKPGLTGLWQVSGRSDLSWEDSVRLDLYYVENWSPALDVTILLKTMAAVVTGRGAY